ncbi:response regulator [Clostridium sp. B9]|uniref:response regulator n=1 Tax=Clostridium sp. B9 TaxID=3423224 RepID=UPI003D2F042E
MYKVMLADDENLILQGLENIIEWEELGLEIVNKASNGQEAIDKFKENPVDIVVTDINMPQVTGLELLKELKKLSSDVKFIILSGYDDFSYAKKAIELGVENYILKPIDEEELEKTLVNTINKINAERAEDKSSLGKHNLLIKLIKGKLSEEELEENKDSLYIDLDSKMYSLCMINTRSRYDSEEMLHNIVDVIKDNTQSNFEIIYTLDEELILINGWNEELDRETIKGYYEKLKDEIINIHGIDVFLSVGEPVDNLNNINDSYKEANNLKKYVLTLGYNKCISKEDVKEVNEKNVNFSSVLEKLNKEIIAKDADSAEKIIEEIVEDKNLTPRNIYDLSVKILFLLDKVVEEFKVEKQYSGNSLGEEIVALCSEDTRDDIKALLCSEVREVVELMHPTTIKYSPVIQQIISYVNENYYEEVSLKTLAQKYHINTSYLGQIFTKEVGCSFSEYLNRTKNMKAKELILNTNMKINDIAKKVGYLDTSYFYRKFKKYYGVCPSTLRNIKNY